MISSDLSWLEMRDAAFILALQEPKRANLIFMDSKIILNLLGREEQELQLLLLNRFCQNPHLRFARPLAKGWSVQRAMPGELLYFRFAPCLDLNESESIQKSRESKSQAEVLLSLPHVLAQRCTAWINNPTKQELHHLKTVVSFKHWKEWQAFPFT